MHIIVVGAQPVGEHLVHLASDAGHAVTLIEANEERAEHCARSCDAQVLHANIDEAGILDEAEAGTADALIATTEDDSINLMTMVMGQEYEIPNLVSTVNSSFRKPLFDRLGVNTLVDPEILAARYLFHLTVYPGSENVTPMAGEGQIYELQLGTNSRLVGQSVNKTNKDLPKGVFIVLLKRDSKPHSTQEDLELAADDGLLVYSTHPLDQKHLDIFTGPADP